MGVDKATSVAQVAAGAVGSLAQHPPSAAGIGHQIQNWHAFRAASRIGQIAATDCAQRIALFCGGTMAEGWACYVTDLLATAGFMTPLEQYANAARTARQHASNSTSTPIIASRILLPRPHLLCYNRRLQYLNPGK